MTTTYDPFNAFTYIPPNLTPTTTTTNTENKQPSINNQHIAIKANFCVQGWPSDACSKALHGFISPYSATAVQRLRDAGAIICGLTNMDEFGMGSTGSTSIYGPTLNPWCPQRSPGGSSSGSAVAVATRACFAALGSDTGGSVRLPASHCGVVGYKPSRGTISRWGLIAYASSLDTPGIMARRVDDVILVANAICGPDDKDESCRKERWVAPSPMTNAKGLVNIGIPVELANVLELDDSNRKLWRSVVEMFTLQQHGGARLVQISVPSILDALPAYYVLAMTEASSNLARYDGVRYGHRATSSLHHVSELAKLTLLEEYSRTRSEGFGGKVQERLLMGALALSHRDEYNSYANAIAVRNRVRVEFETAFKQCDVMLFPTATKCAPLLVKQQNDDDVVDDFLQDLMTVPASLAGLPAISVPVGWVQDGNDRLPVGMQIVGAFGHDEKVLNVARVLEEMIGFRLPDR